jgi:ribose 5-phosphate isomerase B
MPFSKNCARFKRSNSFGLYEEKMADKTKPILMASDHFGLQLKNSLRDYLRENGYQVEDLGVNDSTPVDYPDVGSAAAEQVAQRGLDRAILVCGTGAGMAIVANKVPGVRAVCVTDPYLAERARASNDAQIMTMGSQVTTFEVAKKLVNIWLESEFQGGRSAPKVEKIKALDAKYRRGFNEPGK